MRKVLIFPVEEFLPQESFVLILANGLLPKRADIISLAAKASFLVCCDGAVDKLFNLTSRRADYVVGDLDSLSESAKVEFKDELVFSANQNFNDLHKALTFSLNFKLPIVVLGATGLQDDQSLGNIGLLDYFCSVAEVFLITDYSFFSAHKPNLIHRLKTFKDQVISFFAVNNQTLLSCNNLKWAISRFRLYSWYCGVLNRATSEMIELQASHRVIVCRSLQAEV